MFWWIWDRISGSWSFDSKISPISSKSNSSHSLSGESSLSFGINPAFCKALSTFSCQSARNIRDWKRCSYHIDRYFPLMFWSSSPTFSATWFWKTSPSLKICPKSCVESISAIPSCSPFSCCCDCSGIWDLTYSVLCLGSEGCARFRASLSLRLLFFITCTWYRSLIELYHPFGLFSVSEFSSLDSSPSESIVCTSSWGWVEVLITSSFCSCASTCLSLLCVWCSCGSICCVWISTSLCSSCSTISSVWICISFECPIFDCSVFSMWLSCATGLSVSDWACPFAICTELVCSVWPPQSSQCVQASISFFCSKSMCSFFSISLILR
ncbi:unnamed protein product [Moneuplotes crassus]|uniref:Uncharacterized protein n=1 Tax=Euplotes crassus TaxID=5936 RepID=A0AAD1UAL4_EUPCR|nr:unnamed protein product [Moneuplotes crassus]